MASQNDLYQLMRRWFFTWSPFRIDHHLLYISDEFANEGKVEIVVTPTSFTFHRVFPLIPFRCEGDPGFPQSIFFMQPYCCNGVRYIYFCFSQKQNGKWRVVEQGNHRIFLEFVHPIHGIRFKEPQTRCPSPVIPISVVTTREQLRDCLRFVCDSYIALGHTVIENDDALNTFIDRCFDSDSPGLNCSTAITFDTDGMPPGIYFNFGENFLPQEQWWPLLDLTNDDLVEFISNPISWFTANALRLAPIIGFLITADNIYLFDGVLIIETPITKDVDCPSGFISVLTVFFAAVPPCPEGSVWVTGEGCVQLCPNGGLPDVYGRCPEDDNDEGPPPSNPFPTFPPPSPPPSDDVPFIDDSPTPPPLVLPPLRVLYRCYARGVVVNRIGGFPGCSWGGSPPTPQDESGGSVEGVIPLSPGEQLTLESSVYRVITPSGGRRNAATWFYHNSPNGRVPVGSSTFLTLYWAGGNTGWCANFGFNYTTLSDWFPPPPGVTYVCNVPTAAKGFWVYTAWASRALIFQNNYLRALNIALSFGLDFLLGTETLWIRVRLVFFGLSTDSPPTEVAGNKVRFVSNWPSPNVVMEYPLPDTFIGAPRPVPPQVNFYPVSY